MSQNLNGNASIHLIIELKLAIQFINDLSLHSSFVAEFFRIFSYTLDEIDI